MSSLRGIAASAAVASVAATGAGLRQFSTCGWNSLGSSFDLSPMHLTAAQGTYSVPDVRLTTSMYYFNFCDQVTMPNPTLCASGGRNGNYAAATGWQVESPAGGGSTCYRLGDSQAAGWNFSFYGARVGQRREGSGTRGCAVASFPPTPPTPHPSPRPLTPTTPPRLPTPPPQTSTTPTAAWC